MTLVRSMDGLLEPMNQRVRELIVLKSRYGMSNISTDLYFDGAVNDFVQLPKSTGNLTAEEQKEMQKWIAFASTVPLTG